jgi:hypothetical protein
MELGPFKLRIFSMKSQEKDMIKPIKKFSWHIYNKIDN